MRFYFVLLLHLFIITSFLDADFIDAYYEKRHQEMVTLIQEQVHDTREQLGRSKLHPHVIRALETVPRHEFVPTLNRMKAYADRPLPIGHGQTISQPYIVAIMTELLDLSPGSRVLEIGTGSGYQAAILSRIVKEVYTIEVIEPLAEEASARLKRLGYRNIRVKKGDGYYGWEKYAPFDAIIVTAAAGHVPPPLLRQLKPGGRMIIPVGSNFFVQQLVLVTKDDQGTVTARQLMPVAFVPLSGGH